MKKNIHKNLFGLLKSRVVLAVSGGLILASCGVYTGGYSETDGVYYDPNTDTLPEGMVMEQGGNKVGEYYDYQDSTSVLQKSQNNQMAKKNRYKNENWSNEGESSDWGTYAGNETHYYDNWNYGYGYPYSRFGWGGYYGMSFGWGGPWGYGYDPFYSFGPYGYSSFYGYYPWGYSPYYFGYSPYYFGYYRPYYGYYSPYYYGGYYGNYYNPYYRNYYYNSVPMRRSGADGNTYYNRSGTTGKTINAQGPQNSGFRTGNVYQQNQRVNSGTTTSQPRTRAVQSNRTAPAQQRQYEPRSESRTYEYRSRSNDSGGFRNDGGFRSGGGFGSGSSSGTSSGGTRSGGMRTGGR